MGKTQGGTDFSEETVGEPTGEVKKIVPETFRIEARGMLQFLIRRRGEEGRYSRVKSPALGEEKKKPTPPS